MRIVDLLPFQLPSQHPGVRIMCSVMEPTGDGVSDICFVLQGPTIGDLSQWYDTYDGVIHDTFDWCALYFPGPVEINTIVFMHGPVFPEGGWWTSLQPQYLDNNGLWQDIAPFVISPDYLFDDRRGDRRAFDAFQIRFATQHTEGIRLLGRPGGPLQIITLAYVAAGWLTEDQATEYMDHLRLPPALLVQLVSPQKMWELMARVREITGVAFDVQLREGLGLDHFLDEAGYNQFHDSQRENLDPSSLYQILGTGEGWATFGAEMEDARDTVYQAGQPEIRRHHGGMVWIVVPLVIDGKVLGTIENRNLITITGPDMAWHTEAMRRLPVEATSYRHALDQIPVYPAERITAIVGLLQLIINLSEEQIEHSRQLLRLQATKAAAEAANQAKSEFISLVAHELRNPMTSIKAYNDLLLHLNGESSPPEKKQAKFLRRIGSSLEQMETLVSDLSDISRIEAGHLHLDPRPISLAEPLAEVVRTMEPKIHEKSQKLSLHIPDCLPSIKADRGRLLQILANLLSNASKYTLEGGEINISAEAWSGVVQVAVQDSGLGIRSEEQNQIFKKFFRSSDPQVRTTSGSGLGLSITKNLVEMHGGSIWFQSEYGQHTTFHFTIPVAEDNFTP